MNKKYDVTKIESFIEQDLRRLDGMAARLGFRYAFLLVPDEHQVDDALRATRAKYYGIEEGDLDASRPNRLISDDLARHNVPFVDGTECVEANGGSQLYYKQDMHLTKRGHEVYADCVKKFVAEIAGASK
jgi:hypothetical protein